MPTVVGPTLPESYAERVRSVRAELVREFGIDEYPNPFPHFTLAVRENADLDRLTAAVREAVADHDPISVHTDGIGVFPGAVVWLPVAKSPALTDLHRDVFAAVADVGTAYEPYYQPGRWFPHVGLALGVGDEQAGEMVQHLLGRDFEWDFTVSEIALTTVGDGGPAVAGTVEL